MANEFLRAASQYRGLAHAARRAGDRATFQASMTLARIALSYCR